MSVGIRQANACNLCKLNEKHKEVLSNQVEKLNAYFIEDNTNGKSS